MKLRLLLLAAVAAAFTVGCSGNETGSEPDVPEPVEVNATISFTPGRERILCSWSGIPSAVSLMQIDLSDGGGHFDIPVTNTKGQRYLNDVPEGRYSAHVSYLSIKGAETDGGRFDAQSYGSAYESGLSVRRIKNATLSGARAEFSFEPFSEKDYVGEKFSYRDVYGERVDTLVAASDVKFMNVGGTLTHRSAYRPAGVDDIFYSAPDSVKNQVLVRPKEYNQTLDGYRGIWFDLGQASDYGSKYSGGLGTYTNKHIPMAIYAPAVDRTFFVYGGTPGETKRYLLCMVGCYDHKTGKLQKPRIVLDKGIDGVNDPHDDPTIQIDRDGYVWIFVSGRGNKRPGKRYRSVNPYDITAFEYVNESIMAYPQVMYDADKGFFLFFTRYDGTRQLFYQSSEDGVSWTPYKQLASIKEGSEKNSGHYQVSNIRNGILYTAFNRHINGNVDTRTNLYYLQSTDWGQSWTTADGTPVKTPVTERYSNCLIKDFQITTETHNVYMKDINFDKNGNPIVLVVTSRTHKTGPEGGTREWHVFHWTGTKWDESVMTTSTHCYDSGSIWVDGDEWTIIGPTDAGPQYWGTGGEVVMWKSMDQGKTWKRIKNLTAGSENNMSYCRRPWYCNDGFYSFWADGNPDKITRSYIYFCNRSGKVFRMPYEFTDEWVAPLPI